ncbi:hypothetical protein [Haloarcula montana]|uniref:hypothetical protein n=1 Tax=Haloarcula montana TaxID=3111776 RepID=UPI002D76B8B8|nr:hypothetical protein [Haloarcula sp. GH36]
MTDRTRTIEIPEQIAVELAGRIDGTEFDSVDEYVEFALAQLLAELRYHSAESDGLPVADETEQQSGSESVADQLESLGYL